MKKLILKTRNWLRGIMLGSTLTAVAFAFQACYGTMEDWGLDFKLTGTVKSKTTNHPIKGIKVTLPGSVNYGVTDENGKFDFYASIAYYDYYQDTVIIHRPDSISVCFLDIDSIENGYFYDKEIIIDPQGKDEVKIFVELEAKNY